LRDSERAQTPIHSGSSEVHAYKPQFAPPVRSRYARTPPRLTGTAADVRCSLGADLARVWVANNDSSACDPAERLMRQQPKNAFGCGRLSPHRSRDDSHIQIRRARCAAAGPAAQPRGRRIQCTPATSEAPPQG